MKRCLLVAAVLVVLLVPAGSVAGSDSSHSSTSMDWDELFTSLPGHMDIVVGPDAVRFSLEGILLEDDKAARLRHMIDATPGVGDVDSHVSDDEAATFEVFVTASVNSLVPQTFDLDMVKMDGRAPYSENNPVIHVEDLEIMGAAGPVDSTDPVQVDLSVLLRFETVDQSRSEHHIRLENLWSDISGYGMEHAPEMEIRVQGYRSWTIQEETVLPDGARERYEDGVIVFSGEDVASFEDEMSGLEFEMVGDPGHRILGEDEESPALGPLMVVLAALVGIGALRRRR